MIKQMICEVIKAVAILVYLSLPIILIWASFPVGYAVAKMLMWM